MSLRDQYIENRNYYGDSRVRAGERKKHSPIKGYDTSRMKAKVVFTSYDTDEEEEFELPIHFEVCPTCSGKGTHVNPSVDAGGLTAEDFAEDPDFAEEYMSGTYDVSCYECGGERVVPVIDRDRADPAILKRLDAYEADMAAYRAEVEAERRMGC